jgi:hypothetical protein
MEAFLDRLHARARAHPILQRLAVISRILLALSFIPTAIVKILGRPFTTMSTDNPIGFFFEAMYRSGWYWEFLGWSQLVAGVLVLIPRTALLGAVLFFPIVVNIFVITISLHFKGTPLITGPMVLACFFLLCWDYPKLKPLVWGSAESWGVGNALERMGYALGTVAGLVVLAGTRGARLGAVSIGAFVLGGIAMVLVALGWWQAARASSLRSRAA